MKFDISEIPNNIAESMRKTRVWTEECPFGIDRLRLLEVTHYNFEGTTQAGQIIVFDVVAEEALKIFQKLYDIKFPIHKVHLIDEYNGNDEASMTDNNSSAFNFRQIAGSDRLSLHALGQAIDINPVQNPFLILAKEKGSIQVHPTQGINYVNRSKDYPGKAEEIVGIFKQHGFKIWGGDWGDPIDYHHFQVERQLAENIIKLSFAEGKKLFESQFNNK